MQKWNQNIPGWEDVPYVAKVGDVVWFRGNFMVFLPDPIIAGDNKVAAVTVDRFGHVTKPDEYRHSDPEKFAEAEDAELGSYDQKYELAIMILNAILISYGCDLIKTGE